MAAKYILGLLWAFTILWTVQGVLYCYTCISQGGGDKTCIDNPAAVSNPYARCNYSYCTIRRMERIADPGEIYTFYRGCEQDPLPDGPNEDAEIVVWARSCQTSFCNTGNGIDEIGSGGGDGGSNVIIVPGSSAQSVIPKNALVLAAAFSLLALILGRG